MIRGERTFHNNSFFYSPLLHSKMGESIHWRLALMFGSAYSNSRQIKLSIHWDGKKIGLRGGSD